MINRGLDRETISMAKMFTIKVNYRQVEDYHVFTSEDLYGLYVASKDPEIAFDRLVPSVVELVKLNYDMNVSVDLTQSFREFAEQRGIDDNERPADLPDVPPPAFLPQQQLVIREAA